MPHSSVSLGIITFDSEQWIDSLLSDIASQSSFSELAKIYIVDNGSKDKTWKKINDFKAKYSDRCITIQLAQNDLGVSRQWILTHCQTPLLAFIDSDCSVPKDWLQNLLSHFRQQKEKDPKTSGVCGPNRPHLMGFWDECIFSSLNAPLGSGRSPQSYQTEKSRKVLHLPTTNGLFKVEDFLRVGGFHAAIFNTGEDLDLGLRLSKSGNSLYSFPDPMVYNGHYARLWDWCHRMLRFGIVNGLYYRKYKYHLNESHLLSSLLFILSLSFPLLVSYTWYQLGILIYFLVTLQQSWKHQLSSLNITKVLGTAACILATHWFYGLGFLLGTLTPERKFREKNHSLRRSNSTTIHP